MYLNSISDTATVAEIARQIGHCDFMTSCKKTNAEGSSPWVITVSESNWRRHLLVKEIVAGEDTVLTILAEKQSTNSGVDVDITDVDRDVKLSELITDTYASVKSALKPTAVAA